MITVSLVIVYWLLPVRPTILGDKKYVDYILQVIGTLPGFFIAALAAAATFSNPSLDEQMPGKPPPTLRVMRSGETFDIPMTMRVFICHLFSYLTAISLVATFLGIAIIEVAPTIDAIGDAHKDGGVVQMSLAVVRYAAVGWLTFFVAKIVIITLHGLYFLVERMHLANR
ncbi:hypothetical protein [Methylobacterium sp. NEAU K]|uniref:hypothetical protein n=1 Tax=Methylobacterium sp. NEAU K TaxID=3064946 RepID=UPI002735EA41|nr:hypothetical protein [Methylobacterium sp. NEAU K]MDP4006469.1 hypothetical protein [Methylobacterium sp. NEAU K]